MNDTFFQQFFLRCINVKASFVQNCNFVNVVTPSVDNISVRNIDTQKGDLILDSYKQETYICKLYAIFKNERRKEPARNDIRGTVNQQHKSLTCPCVSNLKVKVSLIAALSVVCGLETYVPPEVLGQILAVEPLKSVPSHCGVNTI